MNFGIKFRLNGKVGFRKALEIFNNDIDFIKKQTKSK